MAARAKSARHNRTARCSGSSNTGPAWRRATIAPSRSITPWCSRARSTCSSMAPRLTCARAMSWYSGEPSTTGSIAARSRVSSPSCWSRRSQWNATERRCMRWVEAVLVSGLLAGQALGQTDYPSRPVRIVVPSPPAGGTDIVARVLAQHFSKAFGQQFFVENKPGAGNMIGIESVARAAPDGYTLLVTASTLALNSVLYKKVSYDPVRDFAPITLAASAPNILIVHPALPAGSLAEVRALAVSGPKRVAALPAVPPVAEAGVPNYAAMQWYGLLAPAGTSSAIIARVHAEAIKALRTAEMKERLAIDGAEAVGSSPAEFAVLIRSELEKWARVARAAHIEPE